MQITSDTAFENFDASLSEFKASGNLTRQSQANKLVSHVDMLSLSQSGIAYLYEKALELEEEGFFVNTVWNDPDKLVPFLVKGTIKSGHPTSSFEIVSELRMLAYAKGEKVHPEMDQQAANRFLEEAIVHNLEFAFKEPNEETRQSMTDRELTKVINLFEFILQRIELGEVYEKLVDELVQLSAQRPIVTRRLRELIKLVRGKFDISGSSKTDEQARKFANALYAPSSGVAKYPALPNYKGYLSRCSALDLKSECEAMGTSMNATGLVSGHHALLLKKVTDLDPEFVPICLDLNDRGVAEWEKFSDLVSTLIREVVSPDNCQCIYGLSRMLGRNLFSRRPVRVGLENLRKISIHKLVEERIRHSLINPDADVTALQYLIGGIIKVLGQPLGVGQGNNPTCQSARGISMWSQHYPAKLIDMLITVSTQNNLIMRFENQDLISNQLGKGLVDKFDYNLDVVSVVLVPHLDKIYNEMMRRSVGRLDDPHRWVNPSMYGHWIDVGFASCYDYASNSILDFEGFTRIFYASFHPDYNGGREMTHPNPVGIMITSSRGDMVGFHAVSLLRVELDEQNVIRAYFLNPNNDGRQDWGQEIKTSVSGFGEKAGESSLPFYQFAARIYAFHYNVLDAKSWLPVVPEEEINQVKELARSSWGRAYVWSQQTKLW